MRRVGLRLCAALLGGAQAACGGGGTPVTPSPPAVTLAVHSIAPGSGSAAGGTLVTIRGLGFSAGATVTVGGRAATDVNVQGSDSLTARTPAAATAGIVDVAVSVGGRTAVLRGAFTYQVPPDNLPPVIASIVAQGSRPAQPAGFADLGESITVTASVRDDETPAGQLEYQWTATLGTISGGGASVTWQAPATAASTPVQVTITLRVIERYGPEGIFQHEVTGTYTVSFHDSARELGDMARRFLTEFSKPQTNKDVEDIMRDFNAARCPDPGEIESERGDVIRHYTHFFMHDYSIGSASVSVNFGARCPFRNKPGDACVSVPVFWDSTDTQTNVSGPTSGTDHIAAAYSPADSRWWLCSSDYEPASNQVHSFYSR